MPFVLDTSVVLAWHFEDEASPYADAVLDVLRNDEAIVPSVWPHEFANGLLAGQRRGRISEAGCTEAIEQTLELSISVRVEAASEVLAATLDLARRYRLTVYDASYLRLAMTEGLPIATQDQDLRAAALSVGVPLVEAG